MSKKETRSFTGFLFADSIPFLLRQLNNLRQWQCIRKGGNVAFGSLRHAHREQCVDLAKKTGTWNALNEVDKLLVPPDLAKAFARQRKARTFFDAFPPSFRREILEWIQNAKMPATRSKRIDETVALAARDIRANQYPKKAK